MVETAPEPEVYPLECLSAESFLSQSPRCHSCGHGLSLIAVRDICGRCVLRDAAPEIAVRRRQPEGQEGVRHLRGRALAELDRNNYPRLRLSSDAVGPGLESWAPVPREMDLVNLRALVALVERSQL